MHDKDINDELVDSAKLLASPQQNMNLLDAQFAYWLSVKDLMSTGGYQAVKKQMPGISQTIADQIMNISYIDLKNLSFAEICTLKPAISDLSLIDLLKGTNPLQRKRIVLQLLSSTKRCQ